MQAQHTALASRNDRHVGPTGEIDQEGRHHGFRPASFDTGASELYLSRLAHRQLTPTARDRPTDRGDESLRNRRCRAGSLLLYREYAAPTAFKDSKRSADADY